MIFDVLIDSSEIRGQFHENSRGITCSNNIIFSTAQNILISEVVIIESWFHSGKEKCYLEYKKNFLAKINEYNPKYIVTNLSTNSLEKVRTRYLNSQKPFKLEDKSSHHEKLDLFNKHFKKTVDIEDLKSFIEAARNTKGDYVLLKGLQDAFIWETFTEYCSGDNYLSNTVYFLTNNSSDFSESKSQKNRLHQDFKLPNEKITMLMKNSKELAREIIENLESIDQDIDLISWSDFYDEKSPLYNEFKDFVQYEICSETYPYNGQYPVIEKWLNKQLPGIDIQDDFEDSHITIDDYYIKQRSKGTDNQLYHIFNIDFTLSINELDIDYAQGFGNIFDKENIEWKPSLDLNEHCSYIENCSINVSGLLLLVTDTSEKKFQNHEFEFLEGPNCESIKQL